MNPFKLTLPLFAIVSLHCFGQAKLRKLPTTINHPAINVSSPYISFDGNSLLFVSDNSDENQMTMFYSTKRDAVNWKEPVMMPKAVNNRLNFLKGFALTPDGKTLYISSLKSGGLGGFDILMSPLKGAIWAEPTNIGLPINSSAHEACPSISPDETTLYFMRCTKMDQKSASECKIFMSKKSRMGKWEEPIELPSYINTGNSQTPRILGDGETLIFSSDKLPQSKGGMDLYITRLVGAEWSQPIPATFVNTTKDDQYVSASSLGRYLLIDQPGSRTTEIVEILFPDDIKPKAAVKIEGNVSGLEDLSSPYISVFDQKDQSRIFNGRPEKNGEFTFYLKEGAKYDISIEPEKNEYTFYSKIYDLTEGLISISDKLDVIIRPITTAVEFELAIEFESGSSKLTASSTQELRRLTRMVKGNSGRKFLLDVTLHGYLSDSIRSSPDLTEVNIDTLHFSIEKQVPDTLKLDSILMVMNKRDSLRRMEPDSAMLSNDVYFKNQIDSITRNAYMIIMVDSIAIKKTYHNDRTETQVKTLIEYLIKEGALSENLRATHHALPKSLADKSKTQIVIKVVE